MLRLMLRIFLQVFLQEAVLSAAKVVATAPLGTDSSISRQKGPSCFAENRTSASFGVPSSLTGGSTGGAGGWLLLQQNSKTSRAIQAHQSLSGSSNCASYDDWPDVDGVTCGSDKCTALVLTAPYSGRCDKYCESFDHVCVAAAEETNEDCVVKEAKRCDEEIQGTSDMLCSCSAKESQPAPPSGGFGFSAGICGNSRRYSSSDVKFTGTSIKSESGLLLCSDCLARCYYQMANCIGVHFEPSDSSSAGRGRCSYFSKIEGAISSEGYIAVTTAEHVPGSAGGGVTTTVTKTTTTTTTTTTAATTATTTTTTLSATPPAGDTCYGRLSALATNEGNPVGAVDTQSLSRCKSSCSGDSRCKSMSYCPGWNGCWMKDRSFSGGEGSRVHGDCVTYYKKPCNGNPSPPTTTPTRMTVKVVSYNIYWWNAFGQNPENGKRISDNIKNNLKPDVLGLQECDSPGLIESRTGYATASSFAGAQGVMMDSDEFRVLSTGSQDIKATGKWGPRYVTWAQLSHKSTGQSFWHFNTHWCVHECGPEKRKVGAENMLNIVRAKAGSSPVIITGDFNAAMGEASVQVFLQNGFALAVNHWVDAILYSSDHWRKVSSWTGNQAGSDHRPIVAELQIK
eukprot:TRINITY_DN63578_c0_g1_i1.p1 TRINITY_DN63578_c0_g1~~TRINITY_DN63578_c0_g1_i1.p1  ORF type:complete len:624 (+),score=80.61 TRINITY_DN63578_c0_g1_i1:91-1962(+)